MRNGNKYSMQVTQPETAEPQSIGDLKYAPMGRMTQMTRQMFSMIVERSGRGLWTCYRDCMDAGLNSPPSEMRRILEACEGLQNMSIKFRYEGRRVWFCV